MPTKECMWCSRTFAPRKQGDNYYSLPSAGTYICWQCADLYQDEEVKLRLGEIKGFLTEDQFVTESGHRLCMTPLSWKRNHNPWTHIVGQAIDQYGKLWSICTKKNYLCLKPIGA